MKKILIIGNKTLNGSLREVGFQVCCISDQKKSPHKDDIFFPLYINLENTKNTILKAIEQFQPDILFEIDTSRPILFYDIEHLDIPTFWYTIDTHLHYNWHRHYAVLFDKVFCAQKNIAEKLAKNVPHTEWLPLCFKNEIVTFNTWTDRTRQVSFVGTIKPDLNPERCLFFERLKSVVSELCLETGDYVPVYHDSKMVINQSVNDDLNYRFFEAAGCGALLVTDRLSHSMHDILLPDEDYLIYEHGNVGDCAAKINWVLTNDSKAEKMAKRAFAKIHMYHKLSNRAETIFRYINNYKQRKVNNRREKLEHYIKALSYLSLLKYPHYFIKAYRNKIIELQNELNEFY